MTPSPLEKALAEFMASELGSVQGHPGIEWFSTRFARNGLYIDGFVDLNSLAGDVIDFLDHYGRENHG